MRGPGRHRSRLSAAKAKLSQQLTTGPDELGHDVGPGLGLAATVSARMREAEQTLASGPEGGFGQVLADSWHPTVHATWSDGRETHGTAPVLAVMDRGVAAGVRQRLLRVVTGGDLLIWEIDVLNPADDASHCPPRTAWVLELEQGRVARFRQYHESADAA